ncbi:Arylesterase [hydrothermal vent metagenome]|uniref:Arylesterase n=1 Tax=hydrothermal vent metagenome TaxID=652676 RepID=A0A3B1AQ22_9ZZZZ
MKSILVYSDSLSWGIIPPTRKRLSEKYRWPCVMERYLNQSNLECRVLEDCLNGRRTVWDDPYKAGRNGLVGVAQIIEAHSPLSLVILMLGTNDFQSMHDFTAWHSAQGLAQIIKAIRTADLEPGMRVPEIVVMAPPKIEKPMGIMVEKFKGAESKSVGLATQIHTVAQQNLCHYFNVAEVTSASKMDGIHLDSDQHVTLGIAMADYIAKLLK